MKIIFNIIEEFKQISTARKFEETSINRKSDNLSQQIYTIGIEVPSNLIKVYLCWKNKFVYIYSIIKIIIWWRSFYVSFSIYGYSYWWLLPVKGGTRLCLSCLSIHFRYICLAFVNFQLLYDCRNFLKKFQLILLWISITYSIPYRRNRPKKHHHLVPSVEKPWKFPI